MALYVEIYDMLRTPTNNRQKNYPSLMWLFVCSDGNPKAQHWPATAVYNLPHIY